MPFLHLTTSIPLGEDKQTNLLQEASAIVAEVMGKPEAYVMVTISQAPVLMAGTSEPAAFGDLRSIGGLSAQGNAALSEKLAEVLENKLGVPRARFYLNFTDVPRTHWGYNGGTFG